MQNTSVHYCHIKFDSLVKMAPEEKKKKNLTPATSQQKEKSIFLFVSPLFVLTLKLW